ncbi:MAG: hypothetical protein KDD76_06055, partial [Rickettsiales bacterium]|nr:hypothetical protein [Rickettsiales bacterium]
MPALRYADTLSNLTLYKANHETTVGMAAGVWGHLMASVINKRLPGILMIGSGPCTTNTLMSAYTA